MMTMGRITLLKLVRRLYLVIFNKSRLVRRQESSSYLRVSRAQLVEKLPGEIGQLPGGVIEGGGDDDLSRRHALEEDLQGRAVLGVSVEVGDPIETTSRVVNDYDI